MSITQAAVQDFLHRRRGNEADVLLRDRLRQQIAFEAERAMPNQWPVHVTRESDMHDPDEHTDAVLSHMTEALSEANMMYSDIQYYIGERVAHIYRLAASFVSDNQDPEENRLEMDVAATSRKYPFTQEKALWQTSIHREENTNVFPSPTGFNVLHMDELVSDKTAQGIVYAAHFDHVQVQLEHGTGRTYPAVPAILKIMPILSLSKYLFYLAQLSLSRTTVLPDRDQLAVLQYFVGFPLQGWIQNVLNAYGSWDAASQYMAHEARAYLYSRLHQLNHEAYVDAFVGYTCSLLQEHQICALFPLLYGATRVIDPSYLLLNQKERVRLDREGTLPARFTHLGRPQQQILKAFANGDRGTLAMVHLDLQDLERFPVQIILQERLDGAFNDLYKPEKDGLSRSWFASVTESGLRYHLPRILSSFAQLTLGLFAAQRHIHFVHNDLHDGNLMYRRVPENTVLYYTDTQSGKIYAIPTFGIWLRVIDFGHAFIQLGEGKPIYSEDLDHVYGETFDEGGLGNDLHRFTRIFMSHITKLLQQDQDPFPYGEKDARYESIGTEKERRVWDVLRKRLGLCHVSRKRLDACAADNGQLDVLAQATEHARPNEYNPNLIGLHPRDYQKLREVCQRPIITYDKDAAKMPAKSNRNIHETFVYEKDSPCTHFAKPAELLPLFYSLYRTTQAAMESDKVNQHYRYFC
jgi:hypothetical protein